MRVITGIYKGRHFDVPRSFKARPTTDFAKENLFNVLNGYLDFDEEPEALDLFAGTGSITIELLSRGCGKVVSVERDAQHFRFISQIVDTLNRFADAKTLLTYGFSVCSIYHDANTDTLPKLKVKGGVEDTVSLCYDKEFRYLDLNGQDMSGVTKKWELSETVPAPATEGEKAGEAVYYLGEQRLGSVDILYAQTVEQADYGDCIKKSIFKDTFIISHFLV